MANTKTIRKKDFFRVKFKPLNENFILKSIALETGNDKINDTVSNGSEITRFLVDHYH